MQQPKMNLRQAYRGDCMRWPPQIRSCTFTVAAFEGVNFGELIRRILQPHEHEASSLNGPELALGERATNHLSLVFHEMATNASKYGALSNETGAVVVDWSTDDTHVQFLWKEAGGPVTKPPAATGFGSKLVATTIERIDGVIDYDWQPDGLTARLTAPSRLEGLTPGRLNLRKNRAVYSDRVLS
jgi:two-component sensor histidine kinase